MKLDWIPKPVEVSSNTISIRRGHQHIPESLLIFPQANNHYRWINRTKIFFFDKDDMRLFSKKINKLRGVKSNTIKKRWRKIKAEQRKSEVKEIKHKKKNFKKRQTFLKKIDPDKLTRKYSGLLTEDGKRLWDYYYKGFKLSLYRKGAIHKKWSIVYADIDKRYNERIYMTKESAMRTINHNINKEKNKMKTKKTEKKKLTKKTIAEKVDKKKIDKKKSKVSCQGYIKDALKKGFILDEMIKEVSEKFKKDKPLAKRHILLAISKLKDSGKNVKLSKKTGKYKITK